MILRLTIVSSLIYLLFGLLIEVTIIIVTRLRGVGGLIATRFGWTILFGGIWLLSFTLAWKLVSFSRHWGAH